MASIQRRAAADVDAELRCRDALADRPDAPAHISDLEPAIRNGDLYQPMWPELEALVGSRDARGESPCGALAGLAE
jgi:hypothetical protein